ncbi:MAG: CoA-binding protein [Chloroflexota bacterium]
MSAGTGGLRVPTIEMLEEPDDRGRVRDILDLQEGRWPVPLLDDAAIGAALRAARRIAVVGASANPVRPSNGVMRTLLAAGYDCVPVNPNASEVLRRPCFPTLQAAVEATGPVDIVDVFRRSSATPEVARAAVAVGATVLWLQLGVVSWEAARIAHEGGLAVVMDRCTAIELRRIR